MPISFTEKGFQARARNFTPNVLDLDLSSKQYIVTGANSGLGRATAFALARRGATVHLICRDPARGSVVRDEICEEVAQDPTSCDARVQLWQCDLSDVRDVHRFVDEWNRRSGGNALDCLINNAGAMSHKYSKTEDGVERNFALNVLGTYMLTELLRPNLERAEKPRVVTVSSGGMLLAGREALDPSSCEGGDLMSTDKNGKQFIDGQAQYSRNKRCQVALTEHWARKYCNSPIFWSVMHPGWTSTPGLQKSMPEFFDFFSSSLRPVEHGADTICWLAYADEALENPQAQFFCDRSVVSKHLWLAGTGYSVDDVSALVHYLDRIADNASSSP